MQLFTCTHCGQQVYFENHRCEQCHYPLGFEAQSLQLRPLVALHEQTYAIYQDAGRTPYRYCRNHQYQVCNWLVPADDATGFCRACALNRTIPDLGQPEHRSRWATIEGAKHRLVYSLLRLQLPLLSKPQDAARGLAFDFVADEPSSGLRVLTGHANGLITLNIAEADDLEREMARKAMAEVYRTVLGHLRHEVGHYYWDRLIADSAYLEGFRRLFGDERADYGRALQRHYQQGPPPEWSARYISAYASSHPWEDWAETWAHYLHIVDTLQTAYAFGLRVHPQAGTETAILSADVTADPYLVDDFDAIIGQWLPVSLALNGLNRSMGLRDLYPFVLSADVIRKLAFIHRVCRQVPAASET